MAINYKITADVVDISVDHPKKTDTFLVDTNAWYWFAYTKASLSQYYKAEYTNYLKQCLAVGSNLIKTGLTLSELAHVIEKSEKDIYVIQTGFSGSKKEFRHNCPTERANVIAEITSAWGVIDNIGLQMEIRIEEALTRDALARLQSECLDGYDALNVEAFLKTPYKNILTDDGDFVTVSGITVFTSNRNVINQATAQGKLICR